MSRKHLLWLYLMTTLATAGCNPDAALRSTENRSNPVWIDAAYPRMGTTGTELTLVSRDFGNAAGTVLVDGKAAELISWNSREVHARVPAGIRKGRVAVEVVTSDVHSNRMPFFMRGAGVWMPHVQVDGLGNSAKVWTGRELLLWGGEQYSVPLGGGARYNPDTRTWVQMSEAGEPQARDNAVVAWSGQELLVVGGMRPIGNDCCNRETLKDGGAYDPFLDAWRPISFPADELGTSPRGLWCANQLFVFGYEDTGDMAVTKLNAYDPGSDTWSALATETITVVGFETILACAGKWLIVWTPAGELETPVSGRYDTQKAVWQPISDESAPTQREGSSVVWTGTELIIWGGIQTGFFEVPETNTGAAYDPEADVWRVLATTGAPSARASHSAVWTGEKMLLFGGQTLESSCYYDGLGDVCYDVVNDLAGLYAYDPLTDQWAEIESTGPEFPSGRAFWTGTEMLLWGEGGLEFDLEKKAWSGFETNGPLSRYGRATVWTGAEMILWQSNEGGQRYLPATDTWRGLPAAPSEETWSSPGGSLVWTGAEIIVWGGVNDPTAEGFRFSPASSEWETMTAEDTPVARDSHATVWTGVEMIVWGGVLGHAGTGNDLQSGGRYNPILDVWRPTSIADGVPDARTHHTAVWTGSEMLVWGGFSTDGFDWTCRSNGARYEPGADTWATMRQTGSPAACIGLVSAWVNNRWLLWGGAEMGENAYVFHDDGALYEPATDRWFALSPSGALSPRINALSAWTGKHLFVWGGSNAFSLIDGAVYDPQIDAWKPMAPTMPSGRPGADLSYGNSEAVWTGRDMISPDGIFIPYDEP